MDLKTLFNRTNGTTNIELKIKKMRLLVIRMVNHLFDSSPDFTSGINGINGLITMTTLPKQSQLLPRHAI